MIAGRIELRGGTAVACDDPLAFAQLAGRCGELVVIDCDASEDRTRNAALIERLCSLADCYVDASCDRAGIARSYLRMGARAVLVDVTDAPALLTELPRGRVVDRREIAISSAQTDPCERFLRACNFEKGHLLPTIAVDVRDGTPLMLAYSTPQSVLQSLRTGDATYWSRSRASLWRKGATSGNTQRLLRARLDCDADTLLFVVEQTGAACHTGSRGCFPRCTFNWPDLCEQIARRTQASADSYTARLLADAQLLDAKICEEAQEVASAPTQENLAWECADLLYFMTVKMQREGVTIAQVMQHLASRVRA